MLNSLDERLIHKLKENARISTSELARFLEVSRTTVNSRLKRLEESGVIKGYTLEYGDDYAAKLITAHVQIKVTQKLTTRTNRELGALNPISSLYAISGDYDLIAVIQAESTAKLNQVLDQIGDLEGVERTNSSVILETKFNR